jgi:hypothetical protein
MKHISTLALAASTIIGAEAINLQKRSNGPLKVVEHEIERKHVENPLMRDRLRRRQNTISEDLDNEQTLYFANASIGTPAQYFRLHIDTGSSDLWVNVATSQQCENTQKYDCAISGTYAPNSSSTYEYVNSLFNISYVDGSGSSGDYVTDVFRIGGASLQNQQLGVGYVSSSEEGILGIGYPANEAILQYSRQPYVNVPQHMMQSGLINTNAYSLWLNDLDASKGSILFGGVNTEKYTGSLQTLPIIAEQGVYAEFIIALTGVGYNGNQNSIASNLNTAALLDSGSSLMYLPNDVTESIYKMTGAKNTALPSSTATCATTRPPSTLPFPPPPSASACPNSFSSWATKAATPSAFWASHPPMALLPFSATLSSAAPTWCTISPTMKSRLLRQTSTAPEATFLRFPTRVFLMLLVLLLLLPLFLNRPVVPDSVACLLVASPAVASVL